MKTGKKILSMLLAVVMVISMMPAMAFAADPVASFNGTNYDTVQDAVDAAAAAGGTVEVEIIANTNEEVTIPEAEGLHLTLKSTSAYTFSGKILIKGNSNYESDSFTTIAGITFDAKNLSGAAGDDACIYVPWTDGAGSEYNLYRYTQNVSVIGCTFKDSGNDRNAAAMKQATGGCKNWTINGCIVESSMHSLLQAHGVTGVIVSGCTIESKNGINLCSSDNITVANCDFDVSGYCVRTGDTSGGLADSETILISNCTLKTSATDEGAIVLRGSGDNAEITLYGNEFDAAIHIDATETADKGASATFAGDVAAVDKESDGTFTTVTPPALPKAKATLIDAEDLTFALNFTFDYDFDNLTEEDLAEIEAILDFYGDYFVDFELTFNKDVTLNADGSADGYLSGQYDEWGSSWVNVPFEDVTLTAGQPIRIMDYAAKLMNQWGLRLRLYEIAAIVQDFDCGVYLDPEFIKANPDLVATLTLNLYKPAFEYNGNSDVMVCPYGEAIELGEYVFGLMKVVFYPAGQTSAPIASQAGIVPGDTLAETAPDREGTGWIGKVYLANYTSNKTNYHWTGKWYAIDDNGQKVYIDHASTPITAELANDNRVVNVWPELAENPYVRFYKVGMTTAPTRHYQIEPGTSLADNGKGLFDINNPSISGSKTGYHPTYWYYLVDGVETEFTVDVVIEKSIQVFPKFEPNTYTVKFNANGGEGQMDDQTFTYDDPQALRANEFKLYGYKFVGWKDEAGNSYTDGQEVANLTAENGGIITLTAQWERDIFNVTFDSNGGSEVAPQEVINGECAVEPAEPTKDGHKFMGWYLDGKIYDFATPVTGDITLTAKWANYEVVNIVVYRNGNTETPYATYSLGVDVIKGDVLDLSGLDIADYYSYANGYEFEGWYNDGGWNSYKAGNPNNVLGDELTVNGWTNIICMVTDYEKVVVYAVTNGDKDNAESIYSRKALKGSDLLAYLEQNVTVPEKAGYTMDKWYNWDWYGHKFGDDATVNGWTNVYVTYTANTDTPYKVQHLLLAANGVDVYKAYATYTYKGTTDTLTNAVALTNIPGYTAKAFEQLNINGDGSTVVKIYYERNYYTLTYDLAGGEFTDGTETEQSVQYMKKLTAPSDPVKFGYTFAGWSPEIPERMPAEDLTLVAQWEANTFTVRFRNFVNGKLTGTAYDQTATYDSELVLIPNTFERTGYTFSHWNSHSNGNGKYNYDDCATVGVERVNGMYEYAQENNGVYTLNAQWTANQYSVTLNPNGGEVDPESITVTYDEAVGTLPTPTKRGYNFLGWYDAQGNEVTAETIYKVAGDSTYTAKWEACKLDVYYYVNGELVNSFTLEAEATTNFNVYSYTYEKTGYIFDGWYEKEADIGNSKKLEPNMEQDLSQKKVIRLYASSTPITYTVKFHDYSGATGSMADQVFTYDVAQALSLNAFVKTGYTFLGWDAHGGLAVDYTDGQEVLNLASEQGAVVDLFAAWQANTYTLSYNVNGGDALEPASKSVTYDAAIGELPVPTRTGYTFDGWTLNGTPVSAETIYQVAGDAEIVAQWYANSYTLTLDPNGGSETDPNKKAVTFDQVIGELPIPERCGHRFDGWYYGDTEITADTVYTWAEDITVIAKWLVNEYTVKFHANGGEGEMDDQARKYQDGLALPACSFTKTGYSFIGWGRDESASTGVIADGATVTLAAEHNYVVDLYAQWDANDYSVSFDANGGEAVADITVTYDSAYGTLPTTTRVGYTFKGWSLNGETVTAETIVKTAEDHTLVAVWEANTYTVTFDANGGEGSMEAQTFTYDEAQKLSANTFTRYGYEFTGWNTAADGTGTAYANEAEVKNLLTEGSITLYAQWKRVLFTVTFDSNGGSEVASQEVYYESTAAKPADPSRKGYVFKGWMLDGEMYDFSTPVTEDITLVAKWNKLLHVIPGEEEAPEEPAEPELPFKDIDPDADYYDELVKIYEAGIMNGTGADKFEPDTTLSRAMVATILYRLSGEKYEGEAASFKDVEADQWYTEAIAWAASKGIVKGYDADRFGPMDNVTREQTAAMLLRYAQYKEMDVSASEMNTLLGYEDASSVSDWALTGMQFAIGEDLMTGVDEKTLAPQADMTRILTAVAVARLMD